MSLLQTVHLEHLPDSYSLHVALFHPVINAAFLQRQLLDGNADFEYAFIDASAVVSKVHALAAAFRAVNDLIEGRLRSRNVHSEVVFALSPNNNISESFRRFGISPTTTCLLVFKISTPERPFAATAVQEHLQASVEGTQVAFEDSTLEDMTNWASVRKYYKLGSGTPAKAGKNSVVNSICEGKDGGKRDLEIQILGAMALRGAS